MQYYLRASHTRVSDTLDRIKCNTGDTGDIRIKDYIILFCINCNTRYTGSLILKLSFDLFVYLNFEDPQAMLRGWNVNSTTTTHREIAISHVSLRVHLRNYVCLLRNSPEGVIDPVLVPPLILCRLYTYTWSYISYS